jgi:hypothetical protein
MRCNATQRNKVLYKRIRIEEEEEDGSTNIETHQSFIAIE